MSKQRCSRPRQLARPAHYGRSHLLGKQAGTVEEALRRRGVIAHVKLSWSGHSLLVQVADPDAQTGYLEAHADAMADALLADSISICSGLRDFIVVPEWRGLDDISEVAEEAAWPAIDNPEPAPTGPSAPEAAPASASAVDALDAFMHGYKMGRLAGVLDDRSAELTTKPAAVPGTQWPAE